MDAIEPSGPGDLPVEWPNAAASHSGLRGFRDLVKQIGPTRATTRTLTTIWDRGWNPIDRRYGTNTGQQVGKSVIAAEVGGEHGKHSADYTPMVGSAFTKMLRHVAPDPSGTFIDMGCGRGRCVVLALEHGFNHSVGIEHSALLAEAAKQNLAIAKLAGGEIIEGDATKVSLPPDTTLIHLFNPFTPAVWARVLCGPIRRLDRPLTVVAHAMPDLIPASVGDLADELRMQIGESLWCSGREYRVLNIRPI